MAVYGKDNIIEVVRMQKAPYWRIIETIEKRNAGNYVATANFENPELGLESSLSDLRRVLNLLTPGRYILTSFYKNDVKKSGVDTWIEVESGSAMKDASISGTGAAEFYLEGIGKVTPENFESAIEAKFKKMKEEEAEKLRIKNLQDENTRLKAELREHNNGIDRGMISIGSVVWQVMRGTEAGKEVIGMFNELKKMNSHGTKPQPQKQDAPKSSYEEAEVVDESISGNSSVAEKQMEEALETLAKDNPELISQLQMMAKLKTENPDMFNDAVENLKTIAG